MNDEMERGRLIGLAQARGYRNPEAWADHVIQSRERKQNQPRCERCHSPLPQDAPVRQGR